LTQVRLCKIDSVPAGEPKQFNIGELEVLVINLNGELFCLSARCTHAGAPLAEGRLIGNALICPWHGSNFRVTDGAVLKGPAEKPLKVYQNTIKEGYLFIER
jgi:nitrite reductase/ring-hydroxylating ferredoxin subunit